MEHFGRHIYRMLREKIHAVLPRLQKSGPLPKLSLEALKILKGLSLLFVSIFFAWISYQNSKVTGAEEYQSEHWPPKRVWKNNLQNLGLKGISEPEKWDSVLKNLSLHESTRNQIQVSQDGCFVYLSHSPFQDAAELWSCERAQAPLEWISMGSGYLGFENLIKFIEKLPEKPKLASKIKPKSIDPKEFHY